MNRDGVPGVSDIGLLALPMHGQHKLVSEGYRTRDGHTIEWAGNLLSAAGAGTVAVVSRPEPWIFGLRHRRQNRHSLAPNTMDASRSVFTIPRSLNRQRWWVDSAKFYALPDGIEADVPAICWNPFTYTSDVLKGPARKSHFDLLDDWTVHYAFEELWPEVRHAYSEAFETAHSVTANSEATLELAHRYGRSDAVLILNGCDPERFAATSTASGRTTVGYVGKIGKRLNLDLIIETAKNFPSFQFIFAGPILDAEYRKPLSGISNITLLGDVHYDQVPALLQTFDIGWVPHNTGDGEVGGDVIKIYEYRAAGLKVLSTPIIGAGRRGLDHVTYLSPEEHTSWLRNQVAPDLRVARAVSELPRDVSWRGKAVQMLTMLGMDLGNE